MTAAGLLGQGFARAFISYWREAAGWDPAIRATSEPPDATFEDTCRAYLESDAEAACRSLETVVAGRSADPADRRRGRVLAAMRLIDEAFGLIHPRSLAVTTTTGGIVTLPAWLRDLRAKHVLDGCYESDHSVILVPRGPLARQPREEIASSADHLADRMRHLSVAPATLQEEGRRIAVNVMPLARSSGGLLASKPGEEAVGFVPVATVAGQLSATPVVVHGRTYGDYGPSPGFDASGAALEAVGHLGRVDVVVMPELVFDEAQVDGLAADLRSKRGSRARFIVAGSCRTAQRVDLMPWNECRVMTGQGEELWRQRKLWPAGVRQGGALAYGLPPPAPGQQILEYTHAGDRLVVADIRGFGRCVVLICQDIHAHPLARQVVSSFQPDWVFVPIFDQSVGEGRWAHQEAFNLSGHCQARFVAITNMAYAGNSPGGTNPDMGLALGPKQSVTSEDRDRQVIFVGKPDPAEPQCALVQWRHGPWKQTRLYTF